MTSKPRHRGRYVAIALVFVLAFGLAFAALAVMLALAERSRLATIDLVVLADSVECETLPGRDLVRFSGRVENQGDEPARAIEITTTIYDNVAIATGTVLLEPATLKPGERGIFEGTAVIAGANWRKCVARVSDFR